MTSCQRSTRRRSAVVGLALLLAACDAGTTGIDGSLDHPAPTAERDLPTIVGLRGDTVVELDPADGSVTAEHDVDPAAGLAELALVRVRGVALVSRTTDDGRDELVRVPLDGGEPTVVGYGRQPAVTADGTRLAFVRARTNGGGDELVATTWDGTEVASWPLAEAAGEEVTVVGLGWSGSGEELVVTIEAGGHPEVLLLPVHRTGTLRGAGEAVPPRSVGAVLRAGSFRDPLVLTMAEGCCGESRDRWRVVDVTAHTWSMSEVVTGLDVPVTHLDWTADRQHLLITLDARPPRVVRWSPGERVEVADGLVSAEW